MKTISCFLLILTLLVGCGESRIINQTDGSVMSRVASNSDCDIYVVEIDGSEYIVVNGFRKAAICPKVVKEQE